MPKPKDPKLTDKGWERLSKLAKPIVVYKNIEAKDIKQGAAEDCYFLSALASIAE